MNDTTAAPHAGEPTTELPRWIGWAVPATPHELAAALWSFGYFFTLLAGYYVLRPLRDQMGIAGGVRNLPWLFTATFLTLLIAQPLYGALVARLPRARFIPIVYHFFVANLLVFWALLTFDIEMHLALDHDEDAGRIGVHSGTKLGARRT